MSTAAHPETEGQTERVKRVVEDVLRSYATSFPSWSTFLSLVEFAINNAVHASTGLTPFFINNARHPRVPATLAFGPSSVSTRSTLGGGEMDAVPNRPALVPSEAEARGNSNRTVASVPLVAEPVGAELPVTSTVAVCGIASRSVPLVAEPVGAELPVTSTVAVCGIASRTRSMARRSTDTAPASDPAGPPAASVAPGEAASPIDSAEVSGPMLCRQAITRFVRDALQSAVDKQKEYADQRGRKNMSVFRKGDRVLLSTTGIQSTAITNLGANKLAPRYIGPFKVMKVLGDAYTLDIRTAMRLHPTFYVVRLKPYLPAVVPTPVRSAAGGLSDPP
ncbi:LOW QUALITY PROTEIN: hypothetical protein PHMEG_00028756 [Phytophthora megakarya]|uniref:Integrase catalytic domain-containing protein n=1 Tax=Phytophthora megakarya TaxID=4795 RepID=A0A225V5T3_9STRA|nr:LOW QUALITY PROTEIN: hypothetical protein PHMEG_00028756 [Phytophthora megakarya]